MGFAEAVNTVITKKYADFQGRAARSEYWWFFLFNFLVQIVLNVITAVIGDIGAILGFIVMLALLVPGIAVTIRRFHDIDKSGWWILVFLIPIVGIILMIYWFTQKGTEGDNQFGPDPLGNVADRFA